MAEETVVNGGPAKGAGGKTVDLPVFGRTKRVYLYGAAAAVAVIVGYAYWKRAADGGASEDDPSYYADTRTGSSTGDDAYAGASDGRSTSTVSTAGSSYYDSLPAVPTTDQQWTAAAISQLTAFEPGYLVDVIGRYLDRQPLSAEDASVIRSAWAAVGRPPGNQQIIMAADTSTPGTSKAPATPTGLSLVTLTDTRVKFTWSPVATATGYRIDRSDGAQVTTSKTEFDTSTLKPSTSYGFTVTAVNEFGSSGKSAVLTVKSLAAPKPTTPAPKPTTTPGVSSGTVKRTLQKGSKGDDVKIVQRKVGVTADGVFGPKTEAAVKAWQRKNGLVADGIVGTKTQAKMGI